MKRPAEVQCSLGGTGFSLCENASVTYMKTCLAILFLLASVAAAQPLNVMPAPAKAVQSNGGNTYWLDTTKLWT